MGTGAANSDNRIINPLALNLYTLGFDANKNLTQINQAVKENIQTYLTQFRMVTDAVIFTNGTPEGFRTLGGGNTGQVWRAHNYPGTDRHFVLTKMG